MELPSKTKVLIVDDTPENLHVLLNCLRKEYAVVVATNGERALQMTQTDPLPDLILLDIMMPGMDGYEVCRRLKAGAKTSAIPIIFVTAMADEKEEKRGLALGAVDFIHKPINPSLVNARVGNHLELKRHRDYLENLVQQRTAALDLANQHLQAELEERKRAEQALLQLDRMKSEFIARAAHELRTPLTSIIGYADLLASKSSTGTSTEKQQEFLQEILDRGDFLSRLIDDLVDICRIESGQSLVLNKQPCDLTELTGKVVGRFQQDAAGYRFRVELEPVEPSRLLVDHNRLAQTLENLVSNAIKFSAEGSQIRITGQAGVKDYQISIVDEGIGMTPEQVAKIFDKFYKADTSDTAIGGLGLGMSIVLQIVLAHGGVINVHSVPQQGSRVTVTLPLQ